MELPSQFPEGPGWFLLALFLFLVFGAPKILSEEGSKNFWVLKSFRSWTRGRKVREIEDTAKLSDATLKAHAEDRESWRREMENVRREAAELRKEMSEERLDRKRDFEYILYTNQYAREIALLAAKHGWVPKPPDMLFYDEWLRQFDSRNAAE